MINSELLASEYQDGMLDADELRQYIGLGLLTEGQFNQIVNNK